MALGAEHIRYTGLAPYFTALPILPCDVTADPTAPQKYPSAPAIRWQRMRDDNTPSPPTWKAQGRLGATFPVSITRVYRLDGYAEFFAAQISGTGSIDYSTITRTGIRPRNEVGGVARFTNTLGTAYAKNGGTTLASGTATEEHQPLLTGNTLTLATKLPPTAYGPLDVNTTSGLWKDVGGTVTDDPATTYYSLARFVGGGITVSVGPTGGVDVDIYVLAIDPGTLIGDIGSAVYMQTIPDNTGGTPITQDDLISAGIIRWDQFWVYGIALGTPDPSAHISIAYAAPVDLPPPYDCPGEDGLIVGGYLP